MIIPEGVDQKKFYELARQKGISISSRFNGVCVGQTWNRKPAWTAKMQIKGKLVFFKQFRFNEQGEREAALYYQVSKEEYDTRTSR